MAEYVDCDLTPHFPIFAIGQNARVIQSLFNDIRVIKFTYLVYFICKSIQGTRGRQQFKEQRKFSSGMN